MVDSALWLRIAIPAGDGTVAEVHFYPLGDDVEPGETEAAIGAARAEHGVPDDAVDLPGWDVSVTSGPLHPDAVNGHPGDGQRPPTPAGTIHDAVPVQ